MDNHKKLLGEIHEQLKPIFENSEQGVYIYLDGKNVACNKKFAEMLGYSSPDEWAKALVSPFPMVYVAEKSRETLAMTYRKAMEKLVGSSIKVTWMKKAGGTVDTSVILVPLTFNNHAIALHFIS